MATRAVSEFDGKRMLARWIPENSKGEHHILDKFVRVQAKDMDFLDQLAHENSWVLTDRLVVKPDQLIKRRGKAGLVGLNLDWAGVKEWIGARMNREVHVEHVTGILDTFIVEPFVPHAQEEEFYVCIHNTRDGEEILFHHEGGVDVGDVDAKAIKMDVVLTDSPTKETLCRELLMNVSDTAKQAEVAGFVLALLQTYRDLHYAYLEINPLVVCKEGVIPLDLAAKIDETAAFLCASKWGKFDFPAPFGRPLLPAEQYVHELDGKTGASLKLTILNPEGRIWTMVAGGGASVVYADTICDHGAGHELANYGEYSGDPSEELTFEYARSILDLMTSTVDSRGKVLIIGGGIANFTDVAKTFKGIIRALRQYAPKLIKGNVAIWVRRGGPNFEEGLNMMRELGEQIGVPIEVSGPEANVVSIVPKALGYKEGTSKATVSLEDIQEVMKRGGNQSSAGAASSKPLFSTETRAIIYGLQPRAVQEMLDFDYLCKRKVPSVAGMVFPFSGNHFQKFYWGKEEVMVPVYTNLRDALHKHTEVDVMINFASFRSAYSSTMDALQHADQLRTIAIIAEGIPELQTRLLERAADKAGIHIIGPATVGGIKPGCFRIGNTGGMIDNIIRSKLYRPGSVAYVSRSGGMSNELNNIISQHTNGVYEGVAIGGDRYPGSVFLDHLLRFNDDPAVKILVLLGEVGGREEYKVCEAIESGRITKPVVAWCIGTCAKIFPYEVQFGHAGALANALSETAEAKNSAMRKAGCFVPNSFDGFGDLLGAVYGTMASNSLIQVDPEPPVPKVPMDFNWAKQLGLVRKPAAFVSSICDDRGEELLYAGMPISKVFEEDVGVGGVLSLLWFKRRLPIYATKFIEMILMVTADHGPAVSGAHNTIVCARAGKDLISSLTSGLLTIGPRFGGALDEAAILFRDAVDRGEDAKAFVKTMREQNKLIMGIGHKIKSVTNPDMRVTIIKEYAKKHFPATDVLDFGIAVEQVTTQKKANLILNVDGCIACCFVDLVRNCGAFTREEADEALSNGCLNGLFVLGRSIGFIGHFLDQKRLKQGLYRHPWDDISYLSNPDSSPPMQQ
ncbi:ATP-citrate synthase (ATP-citrate (pro-S-)-lyase) (Citrate cleavage enzyme) [Durusdinium trenchii]|uniref:ATP citrate synthase n=1 Tax=Durusdinium trenchii TaxID=1381693 RepID=A0ABP0IZ39_9DINO